MNGLDLWAVRRLLIEHREDTVLDQPPSTPASAVGPPRLSPSR
jgi:hypothetical protein